MPDKKDTWLAFFNDIGTLSGLQKKENTSDSIYNTLTQREGFVVKEVNSLKELANILPKQKRENNRIRLQINNEYTL